MVNIGGENEHVEYKKSTAERKAATDSIAAILNKHGSGVLYFGVRDNGDVVGQDITSNTIREVSQAIADRIDPKIYPAIAEVGFDDRKCLKVTFDGSDAPYSSAGVYYTRTADEDRKMSRDVLDAMLLARRRKARAWDAEVSGRLADEVDEEELRLYVQHGRDRQRITFEYDNALNVLTRLKLVEGNRLLNAADVMFCESRLPMLQMAIFASNQKKTFLDNQRVSGTLFEMVRRASLYIAQNTHWRFEFGHSLERREIPEIPLEAVREALFNAFVHRDYERPENVQVDILSDRVEIFSPGALPEDMDVHAHLNREQIYSSSRNRLLADSLYKSGDIESYGSGLPRVRDLCEEAGVAFEVLSVPQGVVVVFHRPENASMATSAGELEPGIYPDIDPGNASPDPGNASPDSLPELTIAERKVLDALKAHPHHTQRQVGDETGMGRSAVSNHVMALKDKGYLQGKVDGRWVVSWNHTEQ